MHYKGRSGDYYVMVWPTFCVSYLLCCLFNMFYWLNFFLVVTCIVGYGYARTQLMGCMEFFRAGVSILDYKALFLFLRLARCVLVFIFGLSIQLCHRELRWIASIEFARLVLWICVETSSRRFFFFFFPLKHMCLRIEAIHLIRKIWCVEER